jgi:predicted extracellular nuclease
MAKKILFLVLLFLNCIAAQNEKTFYVASWNVENLFDTLDDKEKDDNEFLPSSEKEWNSEKYGIKIKNLTQVICDMNEKKGPDILGLVEIENYMVLEDLVKSIKIINSKEYKIVHVESLDPRGIDNALLYNSSVFDVEKVTPIKIDLESDHSNTRFILKVELKIKEKKKKSNLIVYVNHWPSRRGGEDTSEKNRIAAANTLLTDISKLKSAKANIIIIGDFNDEPINKSIIDVLNAKDINELQNKNITLFNLAKAKKDLGEGTFYYRGAWNMLDQMILSKNLLSDKKIGYVANSFEIFRPEYMVTPDGKYKGATIPTYGGKKYLGGYSDHFPIGAKFYYRIK